MAQQQQTVLRVETNVQTQIPTTGSTTISVASSQNLTITGSGTTINPFTGVTTSTTGFTNSSIRLNVNNGDGILKYNIVINEGDNGFQYQDNFVNCYVTHANGYSSGIGGFSEFNTQAESSPVAILNGSFNVLKGDSVFFGFNPAPYTGTTTVNLWVEPTTQYSSPTLKTFESLDLYGDIPLKLNKSFAELQDISKRNSDYSIGVQIPGSKKNNRFFQNYFDVDSTNLFFDVTKRVPCQILLNDEKYFEGYLRLNKVNVINSKVEYDVTLFSSVADLFGKIGNNLLNDLNFDDIDFHFNHYFSLLNVMKEWRYNAMLNTASVPSLWFYPVLHNGYNYSGDTVLLSGSTVISQTRLYTTTTGGTFANYSAFTSAGGKEYRINSPKFPVLDNQLKPALNIWGLIQLMFKTYGYSIKSDFFNTPWFKLLYTYGIYGSDTTKFSTKITEIAELPLSGVDVIGNFDRFVVGPASNFYVVKKGTGIPCYSTQAISFRVRLINVIGQTVGPVTVNIPPLSTGTTINLPNTSGWYIQLVAGSSNVTTSNRAMTYFPQPVGTAIPVTDGEYVDFGAIIDNSYKQIDLLSSIAKKFDLVFVPDPDVPNQIIIEPYDYYIGTGNIYDWTDKLSWDKGFSVQPALNFVESEIILTDLEDGDDGNKIFKDRNNRVYGENKVTNPTDFKSQTKKIDTIFSPEVIRKWDNQVGIPLGINYASQNKPQDTGDTQKVTWEYKGIKSKPKLMFNLGNFSPFLDQVGEAFVATNVNTNFFRLAKSNGTNYGGNEYAQGSLANPVISHTMPMGNPDKNKNGRGFNNDSLCILFNSEEPADIGLGIPTFNAYTDNDMYSAFYSNRINNLYNKNTRFLTAYFDLKLSDIKNLKANDLIKINEQYFAVNKINQYNYTNPELTSVELIQTNVQPKTYPDRYFFYQYCSGSTTVYKFKTYFNPTDNTGIEWLDEVPTSLRKTNIFWSILYDYMVGALGGAVTGYTSSYAITLNSTVYPYKIWEVTKEQYEASGVSHDYDPNDVYFISRSDYGPSNFNTEENDYLYAFSNRSGYDGRNALFNVALDCVTYASLANQNYIDLSPGPNPRQVSFEATNCDGSGETLFFNSTSYPLVNQIVKQGTKCFNIDYRLLYNASYPIINDIYDSCEECLGTIAPTPSSPEAMRGSLLMTFDEINEGKGGTSVEVLVNGEYRDVNYNESTNLYSTYIYTGDVVTVKIENNPTTGETYTVVRRDYTTDDTLGEMGIVDTTLISFSGGTGATLVFTATTLNASSYNFEYRVTANIGSPLPDQCIWAFNENIWSNNTVYWSSCSNVPTGSIAVPGYYGASQKIACRGDNNYILFYSGASFGLGTNVYTNPTLTTPVPNGWFTDFTTLYRILGGQLFSTEACPACLEDPETVNWQIDYSYNSDVATGFTMAEMHIWNYPMDGDCVGGFGAVNYFTPASYVYYSGLTGSTTWTGSTSNDGQTQGLRRLQVNINNCYQPTTWPSIVRSGSNIALYINNIFIKNYDSWTNNNGSGYGGAMTPCSGLTQYTRTLINFDNVTINEGDNVKIVFTDNFITPWQKSQFEYNWSNSQTTSRNISGYTFGGSGTYFVPNYSATITGTSGTYSTALNTNAAGEISAQLFFRIANSGVTDTIVTRTIKLFQDNVELTGYTVTQTGMTVPVIPSNLLRFYTNWPTTVGTKLVTNKWQITDVFASPAPTPTPTPTATPTPTPTPTPTYTAPTFQYKYVATSNSSTTSKAATNMTATFNRDGGLGTNTYSRSNLTWTSSANNTSPSQNIDTIHVGSNSITITRNIMKTTAGTVVLDDTRWRILINNVVVATYTNTANRTVPFQPTTLSESYTFNNVVIGSGDNVVIEVTDTQV
jgi:hypothetical protein